MVLPGRIVDAARDGDVAVVKAFLDAEPGLVNELGEDGMSILLETTNSSILANHVQCARLIIARGGDANMGYSDDSGYCTSLPLHCASWPGGSASEMVSLLLQAGARVNARTQGRDDQGMTPLGQLIVEFDYCVDYDDDGDVRRQVSRSGLEIMKLLLGAGASIDRCQGWRSAEGLMQEFLSDRPHYANDESFARCREIVAGVRAHGSYKAYVRDPHRQFLRLRSLLVRGRAKTDSRRLERLARLPNGACWHVLSFLWEAA